MAEQLGVECKIYTSFTILILLDELVASMHF